MSKKDFFEGLKAQAKINAKKDQKVEEGLKTIEDKIEGLSEDQDEAFDILDEVLQDVGTLKRNPFMELQLENGLTNWIPPSKGLFVPRSILFSLCVNRRQTLR